VLNKLQKLILYVNTLRYLKPIQVIDRLRQKVRKIDLQPEQTWTLRKGSEAWLENRMLPSRSEGRFSFIFLNERGAVLDAESWNDPTKEKLWLYNLHYFEDLVSADAESKCDWHREYIDIWVNQNPAMAGNGWEPYPSSLRIVNWIKYFLNGTEPERHWLESLYLQAHVLYQNLEYHLLGNHLLANGKALVFAGLYFEGTSADKWLHKGLEILKVQLDEQILADGAHFELSPMYHCIILFDLLDVLNLFNEYPDKQVESANRFCRPKVELMLAWLSHMTHSDGRISFFNDAAFGVAPEPDALDAYSKALDIGASALTPVVEVSGIKCYSMKDSGYLRVEAGRAVGLLDCANIGPDYIPGHGHADTLSFELSIGDARVFVNRGTSCYGISRQRLIERSTAAHNTVEVAGQNSSEIWSGFRVARRAYPGQLNIDGKGNTLTVACDHNGYHRLSRKVTHYRTWIFNKGGIEILDHCTGNSDADSDYEQKAYFHLSPDVEAAADFEAGRVTLTMEGGESVLLSFEGFETLELASSQWHPEFGISLDAVCIIASFQNNELKTSVKW
jgi:uncharacterized heparinase superfamily protein